MCFCTGSITNCALNIFICIASALLGSIALSVFCHQACSEEYVPMPPSPFASGYLVLPDVFPCHFSSLPPNSSLEPPAAPAQLSHHGRLIAFYIYISMPIYLNIKNNLPCLLRLVPFSQHFPIHRITAGTLWDSISIFLSIASEQPHQSCLFDIILLLTKCLKARTNFLDNIREPVYSDQLEFPVPKLT